jgi:hypothetical protein
MNRPSPRKTTTPRESELELSARAVAALAGAGDSPTLSLYLPLHHGTRDTREDHIRLKNLVAGARAGAVPVAALEAAAASDAFWAHPGAGMAIFCDAAGWMRCLTPVALPELAVAAPRFHLKPLLSLVADDGAFHVLELHQRGIRLHVGTRHSLREIPLPHSHHPTAEAIAAATHGGHAARPRERDHTAMWFGSAHEHGAKERAAAHFHAVDRLVRQALHDSQAPLVLAGLEWLVAIYREVNHHQRLAKEAVIADTTTMPAAELHQHAWRVVEPTLAAPRRAVEELHARSGGGRGRVESLGEILPLAREGRVASLLVASDRERWGAVGAAGQEPTLHATRADGDEDLLNAAAVLALRGGATVFAVADERLASRTGASALLRY